MSKIIVTGIAGFIGSHLADRLIELGHEVIGIDDLSRGRAENINSKADFHQVSITDFEAIAPLFNDVDYVYHLAALARVRPSLKLPMSYHRANVTGTLNVLEASRLAKVKKVIFASSSSVFGNQDGAYKENMPKNPLNPYALQKLMGEQYVQIYGDLYGLDYTILRFFNVYGPRQILGGAYSTVIGTFLDQRKRGVPLTIFGDGEQRRDFTHITDTIEACLLALEKGNKKDFNIGRGNNKSVNEIAELIGGSVIHSEPTAGEARVTLCDNSKARRHLGWEPQIDVTKEIIAEMENA